MLADLPPPPHPRTVAVAVFSAADQMMRTVFDGPDRPKMVYCITRTRNGKRTNRTSCEIRFRRMKTVHIKGIVAKGKCPNPKFFEDFSGNVVVLNWCYRFHNTDS